VLTAGHAVGSRAPVKAIAFDAFPILDPRPVFAFGELFRGKGADLANTWRTRQFEYMWLRTMSRQYADFRKVTEDALIFTAKMLKLELTSDKRDRLMGATWRSGVGRKCPPRYIRSGMRASASHSSPT
jgi:2-haloacid dehalogenase